MIILFLQNASPKKHNTNGVLFLLTLANTSDMVNLEEKTLKKTVKLL